jgi:hypothetical protein
MEKTQIDGWQIKPTGWEKMKKPYILPHNSEVDFLNNYCKNNSINSIFVLAGGLNKEGLCHKFVIDRLDTAYKIYKTYPRKIFCIGGGSYHTPPIINGAHYVIHESTSCAEYLIKTGVSPNDIYKECASYDTIANGVFSFTNFIIPLNLTNIILITSEFHMERTKIIFDWMKEVFKCDIHISYISTPNTNLDKTVLEIRKEREKNSINNLKQYLINKYNNLEKFHKWFYTEHKAYCSDSEMRRTSDITSTLIKQSY